MWVIWGFDKQSELPVLELDLPNATWEIGRAALQVRPSAWRCGSRPFGPNDAKRLFDSLGIEVELDFERTAYFVEEVAD